LTLLAVGHIGINQTLRKEQQIHSNARC
jgi:hypothetical protein